MLKWAAEHTQVAINLIDISIQADEETGMDPLWWRCFHQETFQTPADLIFSSHVSVLFTPCEEDDNSNI